MRRRVLVIRSVLVSVISAITSGSAYAAPPRVVHAAPDNADIGVDPEIKQLRVEFDQDMLKGGRSICGGGASMPKITGGAVWESPRVLLIPVALEAGKSYSLSINCPAAQNFKSVSGESADAYQIAFTTAAVGVPAAVWSEEDARTATAALRRLIAERYSYRDRVVNDWNRVFDDHQGTLVDARTPSKFAREAARLLEVAQDPHIVLQVGEHAIGTDRTRVQSNFRLDLVRKVVADFESFGRNVGVGKLRNGVQYCLIGGWSRSDEADVRRAIGHLVRTCSQSRNAGCTGIVLDVRPNGGGDELLAREVAALFMTKACVYSRNRTIDPTSPSGWTQTYDRVIEPTDEHRRIGVPVAVLMGGQCMSSNESFLRMMRQTPAARLFGAASRGSSGNPKSHELGPFVRVLLPSWQDMDPDGSPTEGRGVKPDEPVEWDPSPSQTGDPVLRAALRWLESRRADQK